MTVRLVAPDDLRSWCALRQALWPEAEPAELLAEAEAHLAGAGLLRAVYLADGPAGRAAGMIELSLRSYAEGCRSTPVAYIEGWYVVPEARRRGLGRELIGAAEAWAIAQGHTEIASDALIDNRVSERAHLALGYEEVERAIHFRKDLQQPGTASTRQSRSRTELP